MAFRAIESRVAGIRAPLRVKLQIGFLLVIGVLLVTGVVSLVAIAGIFLAVIRKQKTKAQ